MNWLVEFVNRNKKKLEKHLGDLTDWETQFYLNIKNFNPEKLSQSQRNTLNEIAERFK